MFFLVDFYIVRLYHWIITCTIKEREEEDKIDKKIKSSLRIN